MSDKTEDFSENEPIDRLLADYLLRVDAGEHVDRDLFLKAHPDFSDQLKDFFQQQDDRQQAMQLTETRAVGPAPTPSGTLSIRCPHCHTPTAVAVDTPLVDLTCPSCESIYSLVGDSSLTHSAPPMSRVGHFKLIERLGVGGFGTVWKAHDTNLDRIVAIKIPRKGQFDAKEEMAFVREAQSAAQLSHPHIVPVHEVGRHEDTLYIVSDLVQGGTLSDWLKDYQPSVREAAALCVKLAKALHHAHERGVVHRDLKPGNIMIDGEGQPHVMDFGLARREAGEITMSLEGQILGTPAYMSPEQAKGDSHLADRRSDVYSLGVILYELVTGERPFRGSARMLLHQVIEDDPPSPRKLNASVPRDMETIILRCLEKDPKTRFPTAMLFAQDLQDFLDHIPISSRPVSQMERAWRWSRRHKALTSAITLVAILTVGLVAWGLREISLTQTLRHQLSDNMAKTAELYGRNGEWSEALQLIEKAEALGGRDEVRLRLERIHALESLNRQEESQQQLDALAKRQDLGEHEAEVRMLQGMTLLARDGLSAAEPFFLQAKHLGGLEESREALINCMLAETSAMALCEARRAVDADCYSQTARRFLAILLLNMGQFEEARLEAEAGRILFPDDPNFPILLATIAESENRLDEIEPYLQSRGMQQIDPQVVSEYGKMLRTYHAFRTQTVELWDFSRIAGVRSQDWNQEAFQESLFDSPIDDSLTIAFDPQLVELISQVDVVGNLVTPTFGSHVNTRSIRLLIQRGPRCFAIAFAPLSDLLSLRTRGFLEQGRGNVERIDGLIDRLGVSFQSHPDGFLSYMRGQLLFVRGRTREAAEAFAAASTRFSSFGDYQSQSLFAAARSQFELYRAGDQESLRRAIHHMQDRLAHGPLPAHHAEALYEIAMEGEDFLAAKHLLGVLAEHGLRHDELELRYATVEWGEGEYQKSLQHAREVDPSSPQGERAAKIARKCQASLRQLIESESTGESALKEP